MNLDLVTQEPCCIHDSSSSPKNAIGTSGYQWIKGAFQDNNHIIFISIFIINEEIHFKDSLRFGDTGLIINKSEIFGYF